jgi:hypothetical protein
MDHLTSWHSDVIGGRTDITAVNWGMIPTPQMVRNWPATVVFLHAHDHVGAHHLNIDQLSVYNLQFDTRMTRPARVNPHK